MSEVNVKELTGLMVPMMVAAMQRCMEIAALRDLLGRDPMETELVYYENQLWLRELTRWRQDRGTALQKIYSLVWRGS